MDELLGGITPKANKKKQTKKRIYELSETNSVEKSSARKILDKEKMYD